MVNDPGVVVAPDRVAVDFDDERLVADAGIVLPAALAGRLGIEALVDGLSTWVPGWARRAPAPR
jgi:hypothetical protein